MIPLSIHSHFSLMQGVNGPQAIVKTAKNMGYSTLAITDTNNLYGLWSFLRACEKESVRPIIGAEITALDHKQKTICLVENLNGYQNLCRLISLRHLDAGFNLEESIIDLSAGLVVLGDDADMICSLHGAGVQVGVAARRKPQFSSYRLWKIAKKRHIPIVAVPDSYFLQPHLFHQHRVLRAIDLNTSLSRIQQEDVVADDAWLASAEEYKKRFAACPEAIVETRILAERLTFTGPQFGCVLPPWNDGNATNPEELLREKTYEGAFRRYGTELSEAIVERIEHELKVIHHMGFTAYFLIVQRIVQKASRTCGRGSGAASIVAYCLNITNVCPVKHNLYFERFLNPGRTDPPDIDVDFAWDERDDILNMVLSAYPTHSAMVSNHVYFQPRMAIREVAKVYGLTDSEITRVTRKLPWYWHMTDMDPALLDDLKARPELKNFNFPQPWPHIVQTAQTLIGTPRYLSVHPGGVVITPGPIDSYAPIEKAPKGVRILQWEKDGVEEAGLVKIDLLGNRSLGVIRDALLNIRKTGLAFDEYNWEPEEDLATQEAISHGKTMGCFYIESPAMRLLQQKTSVGDFEHLVIHSSIIRPAANEFIREYVRRLHGGAWDPIHPLLAGVLSDTYGIMVYQEDVSKTAVSVAGFSHADADGLRKVLSKKDRERQLKDFYTQFKTGAKTRGVSDSQIESIWNMMMSFNGYSFCKPHSASYAKVSFQAAYLKVHFPAEFMAAVISNQGGFYSTFAYVSEAKRMHINILPPDIYKSEIEWQSEIGRIGHKLQIRVGLMAIKGLSGKTQAKIILKRQKRKFFDMFDFFDQIRPDEAEVRGLIHSGALDVLAPNSNQVPNRAGLLWGFSRWKTTAKTKNKSLFQQKTDIRIPSLPKESFPLRLQREYAVLGFNCQHHPISLYKEALTNKPIIKINHIPQYIGRRIQTMGWLITGKMVRTKNGDPMKFLTFEDETGIVETTFFPKVYQRYCHQLGAEHPFILCGKVEQDWGAVTMTVDGISSIKQVLQ